MATFPLIPIGPSGDQVAAVLGVINSCASVLGMLEGPVSKRDDVPGVFTVYCGKLQWDADSSRGEEYGDAWIVRVNFRGTSSGTREAKIEFVKGSNCFAGN